MRHQLRYQHDGSKYEVRLWFLRRFIKAAGAEEIGDSMLWRIQLPTTVQDDQAV